MTPGDAKAAIDAVYDDGWSKVDMELRKVLLQQTWMDRHWTGPHHSPHIARPDHRDDLSLLDQYINDLTKEVDAWRETFSPLADMRLFSYPALGDADFGESGSAPFANLFIQNLPIVLEGWAWDLDSKFLECSGNDFDSKSYSGLMELLRACPLSESLCKAIQQRIYREKGQLYRDHVGRALQMSDSDAEGSAVKTDDRNPKRKRKFRDDERDQLGRFAECKAFLLLHHGYRTSTLRPEPTGPRDMERDGITSRSNATRFFQEFFEGWSNYERICKQAIEGDPNSLQRNLEFLSGDITPEKMKTHLEIAIEILRAERDPE